MPGKGAIVAQEIRIPGGKNRGGWHLNVILFNMFGEAGSNQYLGFVDYGDAADFAAMAQNFPSFNVILLRWIDADMKEYQESQHQRPGSGISGRGHNGPLNGWDNIALAMTGN